MGNRLKIKSKKLWILMFMVLVFVVALFVANDYKNRLIETEAARLLPKINRKLGSMGLYVEYGKLAINLASGVEIQSVRVTTVSDSKTILEVQKARLSHSWSLFEKPYLRINGLTLEKPELTFQLLPDGQTNLPVEVIDRLKSLNKTVTDDSSINGDTLLPKIAAEWVEIPDRLMIDWERGTADLTEGHFVKAGTPTRIKLDDADGNAVIDIENKKLLIKSKGKVANTDGSFEIRAELEKSGVDVQLKGKRLALSTIYDYMPDWILRTPDATVTGSLDLGWRPGSLKRKIHFSGKVENAGLNHWRLSDQPIRDINLQLSGSLNWFPTDKLIDLELLRFGQVKAFMELEGTIRYSDPKSVDVLLSCRDLKIQSALNAIPEDFIPVLKGARVAGSMDIDFVFQFAEDNINDLKLEPKIVVKDYKLLRSPSKADFGKLKGPFKHVVKRKGAPVKEFMVGPSNKDFTPFKKLGHYAKRGILTCEDGRFFRHNGFQLKHIRASLIRDLREKRFARGGSTITMQTAKNLFLTGKKNLSRKFQEMLIAYTLEQELGKERIFEIYTNIIEWGPDMYGIGRAARHYFYKSPAGLSPLEAAFLGSIISNPRRYYYMHSRGSVSTTWSTYLALIVSKMGVGMEVYESLEPFQPEFGWVRKKRLAREKKEKEEQQKETETDSKQGT